MPSQQQHSPTIIQRALGIQINDVVTTSYDTGPYIVHHISRPVTHFDDGNNILILDHPEISLTLTTPNAKRQGTAGCLNNIRQVGDRWYTAQNDEIFVSHTPLIDKAPTNLYEIFNPPNEIEELPIPPFYQLNPSVNYEAGPRHTWYCDDCKIDFNAVPENETYCSHECGNASIAKEVHYIRAPHPDDRRPYLSYFLVTLNSYKYEALADHRTHISYKSQRAQQQPRLYS